MKNLVIGKEDYSYQILVVDDNLADLELLNDILVNQGYKVRMVTCGQLALKSVSVELPDLILLDVKMPDMDGYEVCQFLKAGKNTNKIPVIFIGAIDEVLDKVKVFDVGGVDYIIKPFQSTEVLARVEAHLNVRRLQRQLEEQNLQFQKEITQRKQAEAKQRLNQQRLDAIEMLNQMKNITINEIIDFACQEAIKLTSSDIGYWGIISEDETESTIFSWSDSVKAQCNLPQDSITFLVAEGGLWAEAIRQRQTIIINDYSAHHPLNKGLPDGHIKLTRLLSVPIFDGERMVAFVLVANKKNKYNDSDVLQVKLLTEETQRIIQRRQSDEKQRRSEERFNKAFYSSPTLIAIRNEEDGRYIDVNEKFLRVFGFSRSEVIGHNEIELNIYVDPAHRIEIFRLLKESGNIQGCEVKVRAKNGDIMTHAISIEIIEMNGRTCFLITGIDITERVRIDEELRQSRQENMDTQQKIARLKKIAAKSIGISDIHSFSDCMRGIIGDAQKYHSDRSVPVLIHGETGTGKELIAKLIHYGNLDAVDAPFVDLNCAAITPGLFESELFGYEAGAFTGGLKQGQKGKFDLAKGGTLFFDEIAEIPFELQGKLLRVLQEKDFYRVGGLKKIKTDVRIICATNVNLETSIQNGTFREDLYYRLKVGYINIPPLRERKEAILPFASVFLRQASELKGKTFKKISCEAAQILQDYSWPGNVRELKNVIDSIVLMHDYSELKPLHLDMIKRKMNDLNSINNVQAIRKQVGKEHIITEGFSLISKTSETKDNISLPELISQVESLSINLTKDGINLDIIINEIINRALYLNNFNKTETANYLGISRTALYNRLKNQRTKGGQ